MKHSTWNTPNVWMWATIVLGFCALWFATHGCNGNRPSTSDARSVIGSALDCLDAAESADDARDGVLLCAPHAIAALTVLCKAEVVPPGAVCDGVMRATGNDDYTPAGHEGDRPTAEPAAE